MDRDKIEELKDLVAHGLPLAKAVKYLGKPYSWGSYHINGLPSSRKGKKNKTQVKIEQLFTQGFGTNYIQKNVNVSKKRLSYYMEDIRKDDAIVFRHLINSNLNSEKA